MRLWMITLIWSTPMKIRLSIPIRLIPLSTISPGGEEYDIECYSYGGTPQNPVITKVDPCAYLAEWDTESYQWVRTGDIVTKAKAGTIIVLSTGNDPTVLKPLMGVTSDDAIADAIFYVMPANGAAFGSCPMPSNKARFYYYDTE